MDAVGIHLPAVVILDFLQNLSGTDYTRAIDRGDSSFLLRWMHASLESMQDAIDKMHEDKRTRLAQALNSKTARWCPATRKNRST